jgi:putative PEP-CTERM system TPR-repeat lipoprotein
LKLNKAVLRCPEIAAWLLVGLFAGCTAQSEQDLLAAAQAAFAKHDTAGTMVRVKDILKDHPKSAPARLLLGMTLLEMGDRSNAELELRKAKDAGAPADAWAPMLARAMVLKLQHQKVVDEFGGMKLTQPAAQHDLNASMAASLQSIGQDESARALIDRTLAEAPGHAPTLMLKARLLARPGKLAEALALVEGVISTNPKDAEAWQLAGDLQLFGNRDLDRAATAYQKVIDLRSDALAAHSMLVYVKLAKSDLPGARQQLAVMERAIPKHPQTRMLEARIELLSNNAKRARELVQVLLRVAPDHVPLLELAGATELQLNALLPAETYLNSALAKSPNQPTVRRLLASALLRSGKAARALEVLRPNLAQASPDPLSLSLAAEGHLQIGDSAQAEKFFQQAAKLAPSDPKYRTAVALSELARGQTDSAFTELRAISASGPDTLADMSLISALLRRQKLDEALAAIDTLQRKQPDKPTAADLRGRVLLAKRDLSGARKSFEQAVERDAAYLPALGSLAAIDIAEKRLDAAQARYAAVLKADPKNTRALIALAELKARSGASKDDIGQMLDQAVQSSTDDPAPRLLLINHWLNNRDSKAAMAVAQAGVAAMPNNLAMLDALGSLQLVAGETNQAIITFGKIVAQQPKAANTHVRLAEAYMQTADYAAAEKSFKRALETSPNLLKAQQGLIALSVRAQQLDRALDVARSIQKQRPKDAIGFQIEGDIHTGSRNWDAALKAYRAGLDRPQAAHLPQHLFAALSASKGAAEASRFAADWQKQHPKDVSLLVFMGNNALNSNDVPAAEQHFTEVMRIDPRNASGANNLAWIKAKLGKPGASALAEKAVALSPENPAVLDTLAFALAAENQLPKAIQTARSVLVLSPDEPIYRLNLARLLVRAGDLKTAQPELESLAKLGSKFARQSEVAELMKNLSTK